MRGLRLRINGTCPSRRSPICLQFTNIKNSDNLFSTREVHYLLLEPRIIALMINTTAIAPRIAGMSAKSATIGPQVPRKNVPSQAPISPATMLPMIPPGTFRPTNKPPNQPIIPPMINVQRSSIWLSPYSIHNPYLPTILI